MFLVVIMGIAHDGLIWQGKREEASKYEVRSCVDTDSDPTLSWSPASQSFHLGAVKLEVGAGSAEPDIAVSSILHLSQWRKYFAIVVEGTQVCREDVRTFFLNYQMELNRLVHKPVVWLLTAFGETHRRLGYAQHNVTSLSLYLHHLTRSYCILPYQMSWIGGVQFQFL